MVASAWKTATGRTMDVMRFLVSPGIAIEECFNLILMQHLHSYESYTIDKTPSNFFASLSSICNCNSIMYSSFKEDSGSSIIKKE